MGLFGKKKYVKNVTRDNEFLKEYATKINALLFYAEGNEKVTQHLTMLQEDFQYTVATPSAAAKKMEKQLESQYAALNATMSQSSWNEAEVLGMINQMRATLVALMSER